MSAAADTALAGSPTAKLRPGETLRLNDGGLIDRSVRYRFRFNGHELFGFQGDTLASALLANGIRLIGRSFKYHRPRGIMTAGSEEPSGLVTLGEGAERDPNSKATTIELADGIVAESQNCWPSVKVDLLALNTLFAPLLTAGFYYKTFMWPASFWERVYEPLIRRAAGLGKMSGLPDPAHYEHANAFCDVLVIGSGPSGLSAALTAARAGARVILCEEDFALGGRLLSERVDVGGLPGHVWARSIIDELGTMPNVTVMPRTAVFAVYDGGTYGAIEQPPPAEEHVAGSVPQRLWRIVAKRSILASGAIERGLLFQNNDRPGVMMASAVRTYANRYAVLAGQRIALVTNNDDGWRTAYDLADAGAEIVCVVDTRRDLDPHVRGRIDARVILGGLVEAVKGRTAVAGIRVRTERGVEDLSCDLLAMSGGWNPNVSLTCHLGGRPQWDETLVAFRPGGLPPGMQVVGAATGDMTLGRCLASGHRAGEAAAEDLGFRPSRGAAPSAADETFAVRACWHVGGAAKQAFVDFQNDVTVRDVEIAAAEGFRSVEHLKRYTTLGMATDQGKTANVNGLAVLARITGRPIEQTGTTTFRPPYVPVAIAAFAGHHRGKSFRPTRNTPSHRFAEQQGAVFVEAGQWLRAQYFPQSGDSSWLDAVNREVRTVRERVGFCDVSTLGKIELQGRDVGAFLDRLYINTFSTLPVGRARYGLMLREDGFCFDDGTTSRLSQSRFLMTTTTANAARVFQHMHFCHQALWPELDVQFVSATDQWAQFSVAGPRSRDALRALIDPQFNIDNGAFPYMAAGELTVCGGLPARLYRLSFSGELAYEIAVPADYGDALARELMRTGEPFGILPYGTEALAVMRIEKGHIAGNEIDGRTTAEDLGLGRMISRKKDFIGRMLAERPALRDPSRQHLVGFRPVERDNRLRAGAHITLPDVAPTAENDLGVVTSVAYSPSLGHWIALGLLQRGGERVGERVRLVDPIRDGFVVAKVCAPCFVDPEGARLRV